MMNIENDKLYLTHLLQSKVLLTEILEKKLHHKFLYTYNRKSHSGTISQKKKNKRTIKSARNTFIKK